MYYTVTDSLFNDLLHTLYEPAVRSDNRGYSIQLDLPGVRPEGLRITAEVGRLTITAERAGSTQKIEKTYQIPRLADLSHIDATLQHGVLNITIPKQKGAEPVVIPVRALSDRD